MILFSLVLLGTTPPTPTPQTLDVVVWCSSQSPSRRRGGGGGVGGAVLDRKLEMSPNVMHNTNLGVEQGFIFKLTKPSTPEILLECYFVHKK